MKSLERPPEAASQVVVSECKKEVTIQNEKSTTSATTTTVSEGFSPAGLRVLVVDDDPVCLMILETMLRQCSYTVTPCSRATKALSLLRENKTQYDLVMSDVYMPDMDGFKLLELIGLELDLPVIMMSANGETDVVMKGITHGACDYLLKPVRLEELRNIWQHVIRRRGGKGEAVKDDYSGCEWDESGGRGLDSPSEGENSSRKRKEKVEPVDEPLEDVNSLKKARVVWSVELHQQFVNAVNQLGIDKAVPKRILEIMNVQGLSRENVASHLQKYRQYLKRLSGVNTQPYPVASFQASHGGNFGGTMQIQPGGRGASSSASCIKAMNLGPGTCSTLGGLGRGSMVGSIDQATLTTLAQLQAHQQRQASMANHVLGGMYNTGGRPSLQLSQLSFPGLQRMNSVELDALMKAASQNSLTRQHNSSNGDGILLGGEGINSVVDVIENMANHRPQNNLSIGALNSIRRVDEIEIPSLGMGGGAFGADNFSLDQKFPIELGQPSPYSTLSTRGFSDGSFTNNFNDFGTGVDYIPSPQDFPVSLLSQVFPHHGDDDYKSGQ